jgi:hypothetical protein
MNTDAGRYGVAEITEGDLENLSALGLIQFVFALIRSLSAMAFFYDL